MSRISTPAVAAATGCDYCVAAHSLLGKLAGLRPDAIRSIREGRPTGDAKRDALVAFVGTLVATSGTISGGPTAPAQTRTASPATGELGWTLAEVLAARRARERERERGRWEPRDWDVRVTDHDHSAIEVGRVVQGTHAGAVGRD